MTRGQFYHYYRPGKPGWSRRWHRLADAARVLGLFLFFIAGLAACSAAVVVGAALDGSL